MLLTFKVDDWTCGIDIQAVEKTYCAAALTLLPQSPNSVLGILDVGGRVFPAISLRHRFSLPDKPLSSEDCFIVARTFYRPVVLVVDTLCDVIDPESSALHPAEEVLPSLNCLDGIVSTRQGLILIHDLTKLLSLDEEAAIDRAMASI